MNDRDDLNNLYLNLRLIKITAQEIKKITEDCENIIRLKQLNNQDINVGTPDFVDVSEITHNSRVIKHDLKRLKEKLQSR